MMKVHVFNFTHITLQMKVGYQMRKLATSSNTTSRMKLKVVNDETKERIGISMCKN